MIDDNDSNMTIAVQHISRGQNGPYTRHTYEALITVTGKKSWDRLSKEQVEALAQMIVHYWVPAGEGDWVSPRLVFLAEVSSEKLTHDPLGPHRTVWKVKVERPYTD